MSESKIMHGWYSNKQKNVSVKGDEKRTKSNIYLTDKGKEVEVTEVCKVKDNYNIKAFTDAIYMGKVVKWVRSVK